MFVKVMLELTLFTIDTRPSGITNVAIIVQRKPCYQCDHAGYWLSRMTHGRRYFPRHSTHETIRAGEKVAHAHASCVRRTAITQLFGQRNRTVYIDYSMHRRHRVPAPFGLNDVMYVRCASKFKTLFCYCMSIFVTQIMCRRMRRTKWTMRYKFDF